MAELMDSGNRREFETGAVRDAAEGKGRCDLLPLDVVVEFTYQYDQIMILNKIRAFLQYGEEINLLEAIQQFCKLKVWNYFTMLLEVSKQFEDGARKYGENNWRLGIPLHCYIDSALRHFIKFCRGDADEPHDRAFCWNIVCAIWTYRNKPEMIDIQFERKESK
jgi:hypothetical protein